MLSGQDEGEGESKPVFSHSTTIPTGHAKTVRSIAWSPSGKTLATASFDSNIGIWAQEDEDDAEDLTGGNGEWECMSLLEGHETECKTVAYSAGGNLLASCSRDKTVWVWEVHPDYDFECMGVLMEHSQDVKCVAWHPTEEVPFVYGTYNRVRHPLNHPDRLELDAQITSLHYSPHCKELLSTHGPGKGAPERAPANPNVNTSTDDSFVPSRIANSVVVHAFPSFRRIATMTGRDGEHRRKRPEPERAEGRARDPPGVEAEGLGRMGQAEGAEAVLEHVEHLFYSVTRRVRGGSFAGGHTGSDVERRSGLAGRNAGVLFAVHSSTASASQNDPSVSPSSVFSSASSDPAGASSASSAASADSVAATPATTSVASSSVSPAPTPFIGAPPSSSSPNADLQTVAADSSDAAAPTSDDGSGAIATSIGVDPSSTLTPISLGTISATAGVGSSTSPSSPSPSSSLGASNNTNSSNGKVNSAGAQSQSAASKRAVVAGAAVGGTLGALLLLVAIIFFMRRRAQRTRTSASRPLRKYFSARGSVLGYGPDPFDRNTGIESVRTVADAFRGPGMIQHMSPAPEHPLPAHDHPEHEPPAGAPARRPGRGAGGEAEAGFMGMGEATPRSWMTFQQRGSPLRNSMPDADPDGMGASLPSIA
ncbi:hypothetical protein EVJ58_g10756, partial [Rhodofomes roseus]